MKHTSLFQIIVILLLSTTNLSSQFVCGNGNSAGSRNSNPQDIHQFIPGPDGSLDNYCVRVRLHKIVPDSGLGGISDSVIFSNLSSLNSFFEVPGNSENITFNWDQSVNVIANTSIYNSNIDSNGQYNFDILPNNDMIDIFFFDKALGNSQVGTVFAAADNIADGTRIIVSDFAINSRVIAHEIGHVLGLFHTYHGTYGNGNPNGENDDGFGSHHNLVECAGPNGQATTGDFIVDTPGDPGLEGEPAIANCTYTGNYDIFDHCAVSPDTGEIYDPETNLSNFMRSSNAVGWSINCWTSFTAGQHTRMKGILSDATSADFSHIAATLCGNEDQNNSFTCDHASADLKYLWRTITPLGGCGAYQLVLSILYFQRYSSIEIETNSGQIIDVLSLPLTQGERRFFISPADASERAILRFYGPNNQLCSEETFSFPSSCRSRTDMLLTPNPVKSGASFTLTAALNINRFEITDLRGKVIHADYYNDTKVNVPFNINRGLYLVRLYDDSNKLISIEKLIITL